MAGFLKSHDSHCIIIGSFILFFIIFCINSSIFLNGQLWTEAPDVLSVHREKHILNSSAIKRALEPLSCKSYIYTTKDNEPTEIIDRTSCPTGGGSRAFQLDTLQDGTGVNPILLEVSPIKSQHFLCRPKTSCKIVIRGYGLSQDDMLIINNNENEITCPPESDHVSPIKGYRMITVSSKMIYDISSHPLRETIDLPIFDLGPLPMGTYTICYAASKAMYKDDSSNTPNFHYLAGTLRVTNDEVYNCDFEKDLCDLLPYQKNIFTDLTWTRHSGATETPGTGPTQDHTHQNEYGEKGNYVYMKSPGYMLGTPATLLSPPQIYPRGLYCTKFWYHMYGDDVNSLRIYMRDLDHVDQLNKPTGDWGKPKFLRVGDHGDEWIEGGFEFTSDGNNVQQMIIEALAGYSEKGDIAIDDIQTDIGKCAEEVKRDTLKDDYICGEVRLISGDWSEDKQWYIEGAVSCSGRGYSFDRVQGNWMPCCVPKYGTYNLILKDMYGDGWQGSKLEFRFFDDVLSFGEDFVAESGTEKQYKLNIGLVQIVNVGGYEDSINMEVAVAEPNSYIWCGAAVSDAPPPSIPILKKYGIRSQEKSSKVKDIMRIQIINRQTSNNRRIIQPNTDYYIYCYAESATFGLDNNSKMPVMTDEQVAASRVLVTTDSTPPELIIQGHEHEEDKIKVHFSMNERGTVWCTAIEASNDTNMMENPIETIQKTGSKYQVQRFMENNIQTLVIGELTPDTKYKVHCYAADRAAPKPNGISQEQIFENTSFEVTTDSKIPDIKIDSWIAFAKGFRIHVKADMPCQVWCGAAPINSAYPSREDVKRVGAKAVIINPTQPAELEIRGVPNNTKYTLYCYGESNNGNAKTSESSMWQNSLEITSFGKFCDMPVEPKVLTVGSTPTPFDPLTPTEEYTVREFMQSQRQLNIEGVYRINLFIDKEAIIAYYDNQASTLPPRYARVRVGVCQNRQGAYHQYKVGPLPSSSELNSGNKMTIELIGEPIPTDCGGYNPQGVFGRRLLDIHQQDSLNSILLESFGYGFGKSHCVLNTPCLQLGPMFFEEDPDSKKLDFVWLGLRTPDTFIHVPFYFIIKAQDSWTARDLQEDPTILEDPFHLKTIDHLWYNGSYFDSIESFIDTYYDDHLYPDVDTFKVVSEHEIPHSHDKTTSPIRFEKFTPEKLLYKPQHNVDKEMKRQEENGMERQENPHMMGSTPTMAMRTSPRQLSSYINHSNNNTTNISKHFAPSLDGRTGLEYRAAPEHIEPQGHRYTITQSPNSETYTINYAGWEFTINNDRDTSLRIWNVTFNGKRIAFEYGLMECLAHYSVAERNWYFMDSWYGGLGAAARRVHPGVECAKTGHTLFWDNSLCIFEQDRARPLRSHWKGGVLRDGAPHLQLVLRQMITVSNYDYITDYYFHVSGFFEATVSFTGELYAGVEVPWFSARQHGHGTQVSGSMRMGALHSHLAVWKVDFDIQPDYKQNSVLFHEVVHDAARPGALKIDSWIAENELDGYLAFNNTRPIHYALINQDHNVYGNLGGFVVLPLPTIAIPNPQFELYTGPCAWAKYRIATTVRKPDETEVTLPRDNKYALRPAVSLDRYLKDNESIRRADLVTWISSAVWHIPLVEDMPLTLSQGNTLGFLVKPHNYYAEDMSMDLHNAVGGAVQDPGTCAIIRQETPKYGEAH